MMEKLKTAIFGKTETGERYTFRQWVVYVWFGISLAFLGMVEDAPLWFYVIMLVNLWLTGRKLEKLPLPEDPEDKNDYYDEED